MVPIWAYRFYTVECYAEKVVLENLPKNRSFCVDDVYYVMVTSDSTLEEIMLNHPLGVTQISEFEFYSNIPRKVRVDICGVGKDKSVVLDGFDYTLIGKSYHVFWHDESVYINFNEGSSVDVEYRKYAYTFTKNTEVPVSFLCFDVILKALRLFNMGVSKELS